MKFLEKIKRFLFGDISPTTENFKAESNISRIDLSHIEINRDLSEEEMFLKRSFSQEIAQGDINSLIKYGEDMAKEINYYLEISRKIINQNLELSSPSNKSLNINDAIKQKVRISFNMSEINSIIEDLQRIKRESEIRLLALEEAQDLELNAASRKVFFFCNKRDVTRLKSIQTAISRISTTVSVITSVLQSIKIEYYASLKENTALDNIIFQNDPEENIKLANTYLLNLFSEFYDKLMAINSIDADYVDMVEFTTSKETPKEKVEKITKMKKLVDLYVERTRGDFFKSNGNFANANKVLDELYSQIESEYYDFDINFKNTNIIESVYGKSRYDFFYTKYNDQFRYLFNIIAIYDNYLPKKFKEKAYKADFLRLASILEISIKSHHDCPVGEDIKEEEKTYYLLFITDMIQEIYTTSTDRQVIKFMDKYIKTKSSTSILNDKIALTTLLRIHKLGREGLFTLPYFRYYDLTNLNMTLEESTLYNVLLSPKEYSLNGYVYKIFNYPSPSYKTKTPLVDALHIKYGLWQDAFADIYKMWYSDKIINGTYIPTGSKFLQIYYALNKKVRMEQSKPEKERLWNVREVYLQDEDKGPYIKIGSRKTYKIKLKVNLWSLIFKFKKLIPGYEGEVYNSDDLINKLTDIDSFRNDDDIPSHIYYTNEGKTFISLNGKNTFKPGRLDYTEFMDKMLSVYIIQLLTLQKYNFVYNGIYVGNPNKEEQIKNNPSSDDILKQTLISGIIDFFKYECKFKYTRTISKDFNEDLNSLKSKQLANRDSKNKIAFSSINQAISFYLSTIAMNQFMTDETFNRISLLFTPDLVHLIIDNRQLFDEYLKNCKAAIKHNENENHSMIFAKYSINPCKEIIKLYREERDL